MSIKDSYRKVQKLDSYTSDAEFFSAVSGLFDACIKNMDNEKIQQAKDRLDSAIALLKPENKQIVHNWSNSLIKPVAGKKEPLYSEDETLLEEGKAKEAPAQFENCEDTDLHHLIIKQDLNPNDKLLTDDEIKKLGDLDSSRMLPKKTHKLKYDILIHNKTPYAIYKRIGHGGEGVVWLTQNLTTGDWRATKVKDSKSNTNTDPELTLLKNLNKTDWEHCHTEKSNKPSFIGTTWYSKYIDMDLISGTSLIAQHKREITPVLPERNLSHASLIDYIEKILQSANENFYEHGIIHRDYKPDNFLFDGITGKVEIVDYGFAVNAQTVLHNFFIGTNGFVAPEITQREKSRKGDNDPCFTYNEKTEVYALGKTIAMAFSLLEEYDSSDLRHIKVADVTDLKHPPFKEPYLTAIIEYLKRMTNGEAAKRPTIKEALNFFATLKSQCLRIDSPIRKIAVVDAKELVDLKKGIPSSMLTPLRKMDEVWIIDTDGNFFSQEKKADEQYDPKHINTNYIRHFLQEKGITVAGFIKDKNNNSLKIDKAEKNIIDHIETKSNGKHNINTYFHVTNISDKDVHSNDKERILSTIVIDSKFDHKHYEQEILEIQSGKPITMEHYKLAVQSLHNEKQRMEKRLIGAKANSHKDRILNQRLNDISNSMTKFGVSYKNNLLTYGSLQAEFVKLENKMYHANILKYWLRSSVFGGQHKSRSAKKLREERQTIERKLIR